MAQLSLADDPSSAIASSATPDTRSPTEQMPVELWDKVFAYLDTRDLKNARLAWRVWEKIAVPFFYRPFFTFRPDRRDIERFGAMSQLPHFVDSVKALRFETGVMDIPRMAAKLGFCYLQVHNGETRASKQERRDFDLAMVGNAKISAIQEYALWNTRLDQAKQDYQDVDIWTVILEKLKNLDNISVSRNDTCFTNEMVLGAWVLNSRSIISREDVMS